MGGKPPNPRQSQASLTEGEYKGVSTTAARPGRDVSGKRKEDPAPCEAPESATDGKEERRNDHKTSSQKRQQFRRGGEKGGTRAQKKKNGSHPGNVRRRKLSRRRGTGRYAHKGGHCRRIFNSARKKGKIGKKSGGGSTWTSKRPARADEEKNATG